MGKGTPWGAPEPWQRPLASPPNRSLPWEGKGTLPLLRSTLITAIGSTRSCRYQQAQRAACARGGSPSRFLPVRLRTARARKPGSTVGPQQPAFRVSLPRTGQPCAARPRTLPGAAARRPSAWIPKARPAERPSEASSSAGRLFDAAPSAPLGLRAPLRRKRRHCSGPRRGDGRRSRSSSSSSSPREKRWGRRAAPGRGDGAPLQARA